MTDADADASGDAPGDAARQLRHDLAEREAGAADGLARAVRDVDPEHRGEDSGGEDATRPGA